MKKLLLIIVGIVFLVSCSKDDETDNTACWTFTTTSVTNVQGASVPGYPQTTTVNTEQCGITEEQADNVVKSLTTTTSSTVGGIKVTVKTTSVKKKK